MDPMRSDDGFVGLAGHDRPEDEARWIADQIQETVALDQSTRFSDIGVLVRSVSSSAEPLLEEFRSRRIPYIVGGKVGLFKRNEAQAVGRIFAWFSEDGFWVENQWKWSERTAGDALLSTALARWTSTYGFTSPSDAADRLRQIKQDLNSEKPHYDNFTEVYHDVLGALGFERLDYRSVNDAAVMANLGRFNNLLTDYETANRIGGKTSLIRNM
jgi:DNA helicase-2/ATP-dependent DNA helicase PcrA